MTKLKNFINCQRGATVIEYVLIAAGVALALMVALFAFGDEVGILYNGLATALSGG